MSSPESSGLSSNDVWQLDLPPLADVQGRASLDRARLPEHLAPVAERVLESVGAGAKLVILVRGGKAARDESHDRNLIWEAQADLSQLVHRGLARDERLDGFELFCPDDRTQGKDVKISYGALATAARAIEETSGNPGQALLDWLKKSRERSKDPRGAVVVLTPEVAASLGNTEKEAGEQARYLFSKLQRLFPADQTAVIQAPPAPENLYTMWERHVQGARVDECRRLLMAAMAHPIQGEGVVDRAARFPTEFKTQEVQEGPVKETLRQIQRMMMGPAHLLLHGPRGVGKTTALAGVYQVAKQLGLGSHYTAWQAAGAQELGAELIERGFLVSPSKDKAPDQFLCVDEADIGSVEGDTTLQGHQRMSHDALERMGKLVTKRQLETVLSARQLRLAARTRMMMTSNLGPSELRKRVIESLTAYAVYFGHSGGYQGNRTLKPLTTLAYALGEPLAGEEIKNATPLYDAVLGRDPRLGTGVKKTASPALPGTYNEFTGRLHAVELGGQDWGTLATGGVEWSFQL